jgi:hypothetical protein
MGPLQPKSLPMGPLQPKKNTPLQNPNNHESTIQIFRNTNGLANNILNGGPGQCSLYSDSLQPRRFGDRTPVGARHFLLTVLVQAGPGAHPASCTMGTGDPSRGEAAGTWRLSPTHPHTKPM